MGLTLKIGYLAEQLTLGRDAAYMQEQFALINELLAERGLPTHSEPTKLPIVSRPLSGGPYSWFFLLWRAYARCVVHKRPNLQPADGDGLTSADERLIHIARFAAPACHLLRHSDADGFYIPVDFPKPIYDERLAGEVVGSSYRLREELLQVAPYLDIKLEEDELSPQEAERLLSADDELHPFGNERAAWMALFDSSRVSIEYSTTVVFA